jgi:hypothetical protein
MSGHLDLQRADLPLLREALAYVARRIYARPDAEVVGVLEEKLDALLLDGQSAPRVRLGLAGDQARVLRLVLESYAAQLDHPSADSSNRARVARLRHWEARLARQTRWFGRLAAWIKARW